MAALFFYQWLPVPAFLKSTAQISTGTVPAGVQLVVVAAAATGTGKGTPGTPVSGGVIPGPIPLDIITGIGSTCTGKGPVNGRQLASLSLVNNAAFDNLDFKKSGTFSVT